MRRPASWVLVAALLAAGAACGDSGGDNGPTATIAHPKSTTTSAPKTVEAQVEAAYLKSWKVYANAMRTLDGSAYDSVFTDDALTLRNEELDRLRAAHTPVRIDVVHHYSVKVFDEDRQAVVLDAYENHSVLLDPITLKPSEPDPNNVLKREYQFRKVDGTWKIVHVIDAS